MSPGPDQLLQVARTESFFWPEVSPKLIVLEDPEMQCFAVVMISGCTKVPVQPPLKYAALGKWQVLVISPPTMREGEGSVGLAWTGEAAITQIVGIAVITEISVSSSFIAKAARRAAPRGSFALRVPDIKRYCGGKSKVVASFMDCEESTGAFKNNVLHRNIGLGYKSFTADALKGPRKRGFHSCASRSSRRRWKHAKFRKARGWRVALRHPCGCCAV